MSDGSAGDGMTPLARGIAAAQAGGVVTADTSLEGFVDAVEAKGIALYPAQEEAILELLEGANVILRTPTGSGKSLVAAALHYHLTCRGERSYYTCPIKALVNEKFLALCHEFGAENVGISTGDATVNAGAPILCCTAEVLANLALREGRALEVGAVIMDEFHYYSDRERGVAWQVPLLTLPQAQFLLISATLGDTRFFERELERLTGRRSVTVSGSERPVPLSYHYTEESLEDTLERLRGEDELPAYIVHFTQRGAVETAHGLVSLNLLDKAGRAELGALIADEDFSTPFGRVLKKYLRHGVGVHHAGMLPRYRLLVEKLAQQNRLRVICGTDTLGVGVNVPIRTVLFTGLAKYDGQQMGIMPVRDFHQIAGRAGRKGYDDHGMVVCLAPPHVIENRKRERKAKAGSKGKKPVSKQPEKGTVQWDEKTWQRLIDGEPEGLSSQFQVTHAVVLNVLSRDGDGCADLRRLIRDCHDGPGRKAQHVRRSWQLFRSLVDKRVIELLPQREANGRKVRLHIDLQEDFSLNHALSLYLVDTVDHLDKAEPGYALLVLSLVEAVLEDPGAIIRQQVDRVKDALMAEMKAEGVPYEERIERLQDVEHPKPERDFIYNTFNNFAAAHPWVGDEAIRPKSIARDMLERYLRFEDYVRELGLARAEGLLLRHLANVYKTLSQSVPEAAWTEELVEIMVYLEEMLQAVDSSMLDEWSAIRDPGQALKRTGREVKLPEIKSFRGLDPQVDMAAFRRTARNAVFPFIRALAQGDYRVGCEILAGLVGRPAEDAAPPPVVHTADSEINEGRGAFEWYAERLEAEFAAYTAGHGAPLLDPEGRAARHTVVEVNPLEGGWWIRQTLVDAEGLNDWELQFGLLETATREANTLRMRLIAIQPIQ